jgi:hypothetical protein
MWISQTPIIVDVPEARINAVNDPKSDVCGSGRGPAVHTVNAECCIEQDSGSVLSAVQQMGEFISSVFVSAQTLQQPPYTRQRRKKPGNAQMRRVAL